MTRQILLLAILAVVISSCSTAYKTGQTPDDVYYSPERPRDAWVQNDKEDRYQYEDEYYDDRYLRMKVRNRTRWNELNDWYYYDRYSYTYNYHYGTWNNPYNSWNYYYNPYCPSQVVVVNPKGPRTNTVITRPRSFNISSYTNENINNGNAASPKLNKPGYTSKPTYNNTNRSTGIRKIFTPSENRTERENTTPSRTYTPSSSSSNSSSSGSSGSGSSGSGSSGGGVSRPTRGGN